MKPLQIRFWPVLLTGLLLLTVSACQRDSLPTASSTATTHGGSIPSKYVAFNDFGSKLEEPFSYAIQDHSFARSLVKMAMEMEDGDTEVLLSQLLNTPLDNQMTGKEFLLQRADGIFTEKELNQFLSEYPSTIVGLRGKLGPWLTSEEFVPAVKFVPFGFDEQKRTIVATRLGARAVLDFGTGVDEPVIAIHLSERHDEKGDLITPKATEQTTREVAPALGLQDLENTSTLRVNCGPEPSACPAVMPVVDTFTATARNGGIELYYNITNFPNSLCKWGRIRITRFNPDGSTKVFNRRADDLPLFYDSDGGVNVTYTYRIDAYLAWIGPNPAYPNGSFWKWFTCPAQNNLQLATATFPLGGGRIESYRGSNLTSSTIRYDWFPPQGASINEFRIRRSTPSGFQTVSSSISAWNTSYFYNVPASLRGTLVETQIEYRSGGPWRGAYFDKTYASFRDPGQPFYYYGFRGGSANNWDFGEHPLFGTPEIRLLATQASAGGATIELAEAVIPMRQCFIFTEVSSGWFGGTTFDADPTGVFYPAQSPNGFLVLSSWDADLAGTAITIKTFETDISQVAITEATLSDTREADMTASLGTKLEEEPVNIGISSTWGRATERKYRYPASDIPINGNIIYYHEHPTTVRGTELFGNISFLNHCDNLLNHL